MTKDGPFGRRGSSFFRHSCLEIRHLATWVGETMLWIFRAARRLRAHGILGMNRRNAEYILDHNPRDLFPIVDDKLKMRALCQRIGVPAPAVFAVISSFGKLKDLGALLDGRDEFVV